MTQMLRRLAFILLCRRQDFHRAARLLDRRDGGFRSAVNLDIQLGLEFTAAEQPHAVLRAPDHAGFHQRFGVDGAVGVERLGVDRFLYPWSMIATENRVPVFEIMLLSPFEGRFAATSG